MSLAFGDDRTGGPAKAAIGIAVMLLLVVTVGLASGGGPGWYLPLLVVVPLFVVFVLWVSCRRKVVLCEAPLAVVVTRTLWGLAWRRRIGFGRFSAVLCRGVWMRPRGGNPQEGTPEGDARFIKYELSLRRGRRGLHLDFLGDVEMAEGLARRAAARVGVPAERRDYGRRADGLPLWRRGARERLV